MALLPDLRFSPYVKPYVGSSLNEYKDVLASKISAYDEAKAIDDTLSVQSEELINNVLPQDRNSALKIADLYRKKIEDRVSTGNYEDLGEFVNRDARQFSSQIVPFKENYKRFSDWNSTIDKRVQEGKLDRITAERAKQYATQTYGGIDLNNIQGTLFQGYNPANSFNVSEFINKIGNDWESAKNTIEIPKADGTGTITISKDQLTPEVLAEGFQNYLRSNRDFNEYANTQNELTLTDKLQQEVNDAILAGIQKYSKNNISQTQTDASEWLFKLKKQQEALNAPTISLLQGNPNTLEDDPLLNIEYDDKGNVKIKGVTKNEDGTYTKSIYSPTTEQVKSGTKAITGGGVMGGTTASLLPTGQERFSSKQYEDEAREADNNVTSLVNAIRQVNGVNPLKPITKIEKEQALNTFKEARKNFTFGLYNKGIDFPVENGKSINTTRGDFAVQDIGNRQIVILGDPKSNEFSGLREKGKTDYNSLLEEINDKGYEIAKDPNGNDAISPTKVAFYNPITKAPGIAVKMFLKPKEGSDKAPKQIEAIISDNDLASSPLSIFSQIYNEVGKGKFESSFNFNGTEIIVKSIPTNNKDNPFLINIQERFPDGTVESSSLKEFENKYENVLKEKGYFQQLFNTK